jgi:hypothetical protein
VVDLDANRFGNSSSDQNTCVFALSGNYNTMGIMNNVNTAVTPLLEYTQQDLITKNIGYIQPLIWSENHDWILRRYFNTLVARVVEIERIVMVCTKKHFLKSISIYVKILPKLTSGIEIIGFMNERAHMRDTCVMFVDMHDGMMLGITKNVMDQFGIPVAFMYGFAQEGTEFNIDQFCPELLDLYASGDIANPNGNICTLDTTILTKNYYLANNDESEEEPNDDELEENFGMKREIDKFNYSMDVQNKYRQAKINVTRFAEIQYPPKLLNILLFNEISDETD